MRTKVLVAEDDPSVAYALERLLRAWGYDVSTAAHSDEATAILDGAEPPTILLVAKALPGVGGLELCRRARRSAGTRAMYVVMLSAITDSIAVEEILAAGADDLLGKPFEVETLRARLAAGVHQIESGPARAAEHGSWERKAKPREGGETMQEAKVLDLEVNARASQGLGRDWSHGGELALIRRLERQQAAISRFTAAALTAATPAALSLDLAREAHETLEAAVEVRELDADGNRLTVRGAAGAGAAAPGTTSELSLSLYELRAVESGAPVLLADGGVCVAVAAPARRFGVVIAHPRRRRFGTGEIEFITTLARILAGVAERERLESLCMQAQKMEALGQLAGGVAHDFNNVLAVIGTSAFTLEESLRRLPTEIEGNEDLGLINRAVDRGRLLVRRLLAFSRRQAERATRLDLNDVIDEARGMLERLLAAQVELSTTLVPSRLPILADLGELEQVIVNLVVNARDAMPNGGHVRIETQQHAHESGCDGRCYAAFVVSDTGVGMNPEVQRRLFEPFFTTKGPGRGTGLGLPIVKQIVERAGGSVQVDSAPGAGTRITVLWPCEGSCDKAEAPRRLPSNS